ncbi:MAG: orotidine-5'-phosphate decarboxylase [bacterium]|nr:orotidine-5'-phosphate decarboxylase [bacterium]
MKPKDHLILALDVDSLEEAKDIVDELKDMCGIFKVGPQLFTIYGVETLRMIQRAGCKTFLDLKYHDIPNTLKEVADVVVKLGVYMFTIHTLGGREMMRVVVEEIRQISQDTEIPKPLVLGVTILTSISQRILEDDLGIKRHVKDQVVFLAEAAKEVGLDGVIASPYEVASIRERCGKDFLIVTPGIRMEERKDDQKRVMTPREAIRDGANYLVVGRPIIYAPNRRDEAKRFLEDIETGLMERCGVIEPV